MRKFFSNELVSIFHAFLITIYFTLNLVGMIVGVIVSTPEYERFWRKGFQYKIDVVFPGYSIGRMFGNFMYKPLNANKD